MVKVLPSIAFELYVYSTRNSSFNRSNSPSVKGLISLRTSNFFSIIGIRDSVFLYLPSVGFTASDGIFQLLPSLYAPGIFPSEHKILTLLSETPHFSAACFTVMYINYPSNLFVLYYFIGIISTISERYFMFCGII